MRRALSAALAALSVIGTAALSSLRMGDDSKRRAIDYRVDNIVVSAP